MGRRVAETATKSFDNQYTYLPGSLPNRRECFRAHWPATQPMRSFIWTYFSFVIIPHFPFVLRYRKLHGKASRILHGVGLGARGGLGWMDGEEGGSQLSGSRSPYINAHAQNKWRPACSPQLLEQVLDWGLWDGVEMVWLRRQE